MCIIVLIIDTKQCRQPPRHPLQVNSHPVGNTVDIVHGVM